MSWPFIVVSASAVRVSPALSITEHRIILATVIEGFGAGSSVCYPRLFVATLYQNRMLFEDA